MSAASHPEEEAQPSKVKQEALDPAIALRAADSRVPVESRLAALYGGL